MQSTAVSQARKKNPDSCRAFWTMSLLFLLVLPLSLLATEAGAAKIIFEPSELRATVAPGEVVTIPVAVSLSDTSLANSSASFSISHLDGTLEPAWINNQVYVTLNSSYSKSQIPFQVNVPADAKVGNYKSVFRTFVFRADELVTPADLVINVDVGETFTCNQVPLFSNISSAAETINARNHKEVTIELSGQVSETDGCDIFDTWYQLIDEYGKLDQDKVPLNVNDDGTFSVAIPMVASRMGEDEDGRLYTVTFFAENEAGVGDSPETSVVVLHDDHKEREHDSKKKGPHSKKKGHDNKNRES